MDDLGSYFVNGVTPIEASAFNGFGAGVVAAVTAAQAERQRAEAAADAAMAPTDSAVADLLASPSSSTHAAARALLDDGLGAVGHVIPAATSTGGTDPAASVAGGRLLDILRRNARYNLNTWWSERWASQDASTYLDLGGVGQHQVRPVASAALGVAALLHTGVWDDTTGGVPEALARGRAVRWVKALAFRHRATTPGGWGGEWQSSLWAALAGTAGWLLWDDLTEDDRAYLADMVADEADRPHWAFPRFWKNPAGVEQYPGDSKAEELAWMAMIWSLAVAMMPTHPNVPIWRSRAAAFHVAAWSVPADMTDPSVVEGRAVADYVAGWNVNTDGTVINHNLVHPDYMAAASLSLFAVIPAALGGQPASRAALRGVDRVWAAFTQRTFSTADGYAAPGGTIYVSGSASLYYPQGNDWSDPGLSTRVMDKAAIDVMVSGLGLDRGVSPTAEVWAERHLGAVQALQARSSTGQVYQAAGEDTYAGREQWVSMNAAIAWLCRWVARRGLYAADESGRVTSGGRLRVLTGSVTLPTPSTTTQATPAQTFGGVRFLEPPAVLVGEPISSGGVGVRAHAISVTQTGFQVRYVATAAFGSSPDATWIAVGLVP